VILLGKPAPVPRRVVHGVDRTRNKFIVTEFSAKGDAPCSNFPSSVRFTWPCIVTAHMSKRGNDSSTAWFERDNAGDASEPSTSCCWKPPSTPIPTVNNPIRQRLRPVWPGAGKKRASQRFSGGRKCLHTEPASPHRRWAKLDSTSLPASMDSERGAERIEIHRMTGQYQKCSQWDSFSAACYRTIFE